VTRQRKVTDKGGKVHELAVIVYGWKGLVLSEARTKMPVAVKVVKLHDHEVLWRRALVLQAQATLAGATRLDQLSFARGFVAGLDRWWLDQRGIT
jgi:hypothetical protein